VRDEDLPFREKCAACERIARFAIMHPDPMKMRTKYVCSDHVSALREAGQPVFRIEDGESVI